jgi:hypothetical protein
MEAAGCGGTGDYQGLVGRSPKVSDLMVAR